MAHFHWRASHGLVRYSQALVGQAHVMLRLQFSSWGSNYSNAVQARAVTSSSMRTTKPTSAVSCQHSELTAPHICSETRHKLNKYKPQTACVMVNTVAGLFMSVQAVVVSVDGRSIYCVSLANLHLENTHFKMFFACRLSADLSKH